MERSNLSPWTSTLTPVGIESGLALQDDERNLLDFKIEVVLWGELGPELPPLVSANVESGTAPLQQDLEALAPSFRETSNGYAAGPGYRMGSDLALLQDRGKAVTGVLGHAIRQLILL